MKIQNSEVHILRSCFYYGTGYQCYNRSQKISALNDVLLPIYKGIKCVTQFVTLS